MPSERFLGLFKRHRSRSAEKHKESAALGESARDGHEQSLGLKVLHEGTNSVIEYVPLYTSNTFNTLRTLRNNVASL
jgi:hypothetical protein